VFLHQTNCPLTHFRGILLGFAHGFILSREEASSKPGAVQQGKRIRATYKSRSKQGEVTERELSPQRLVLYKGNWYLDAMWHPADKERKKHPRDELRTFSVDRFLAVVPLEVPATQESEDDLDLELGSGYGLFSGKNIKLAKLKFSKESAPWVVDEQWHSKQKGKLLKEGAYLLEIPYAKDMELIMDILRHVPEVEVLGPPDLRKKVAAMLAAGLKKFSDDGA
jgi:predicted DNA-binding transcriptional regulator YafY